MRNIWTIAWNEFKQYFVTPVAYAVTSLIFLFLGLIFALQLYQLSQSQYSQAMDGQQVLGPMLTLVLFAMPAITMRLIAEENQRGTLELMLTSPIRDSELVMGKWLASIMLGGVILLLTWFFPIFLNVITKPGIDQGPLVSAYLMMFLVICALAAIGLCVSSFFSNPTAAFFVTLAIGLGLWLSGMAAGYFSYIGTMGGTSWTGDFLRFLDFTSHFYDNAYVGKLDLRDALYYISLIILSLFIATRSVESKRWR